MDKPKQKKNKKQLLIDGLYNYITTRGEEQLQLKPDEFENLEKNQNDFSLYNKEDDLEQYKKDYSSRIDKQILIIAQNIMNSLFGLNNEKFSAFMSRYNVWGFDLTMQQFINSFYLVVKTDNMLRQFILDHMDKIINVTRNVMQKYLITHMSSFTFNEARTDYNKKKLLNKMKKNQIAINEKMKQRNVDPVKKNEEVETPTSGAVVAPNTEGQINTTPIIGQPQLEINNLTSGNIGQPRIYSLEEMMNMSDEQLDQATQFAQPNPIEDNLSGITPPPIQSPEELLHQNKKEQNTEQEPKTTEQPPSEQPSEEEIKMQQQILANLKKQHQNLQRGATNNV